MMAGFVILCLAAGIFIGIGISCLFAKKATGFWANVKRPLVCVWNGNDSSGTAIAGGQKLSLCSYFHTGSACRNHWFDGNLRLRDREKIP